MRSHAHMTSGLDISFSKFYTVFLVHISLPMILALLFTHILLSSVLSLVLIFFLSNIHFSQNLKETNQDHFASPHFIGIEKSKILTFKMPKIYTNLLCFGVFIHKFTSLYSHFNLQEQAKPK